MKLFRDRLQRIFLSVVILLGVTSLGRALAEDISFEATVDSNTVELGSSLQLSLTLNGATGEPPVQIPKIDGLETRYLGPSTRVSIINGQMSRSVSMNFTAIPLKVGKIQIPAISIIIDGKTYSTQPIDITVTASSPKGTAPAAPSGGAIQSVGGLQDKIFIVMTTPKKEVYLNEPLPLVIKLYVNQLQVKNVQYPTFNHEGFSVDEFQGQPPQYMQSLGGVAYQVLEFKTMIYPTRVGELSVGPAKLSANIMIKSSRHRSDPFGNLFDDDIFDNLLGGYDLKTISVESADLRLNVLPLPEENKPKDFSGAVGKYAFDMTASPQEVKVGDPVTIKMRVSGTGDLKSINMPSFPESKDYKLYDPKISEQDGGKILEQVLIPNTEQLKEIPAVSMNYFDDEQKKYITITKGPFSLVVKPLEKGEESKVVGLSAPTSLNPAPQPEELGRDIHFIKEDPGVLSVHGRVFYSSPGYLLFLGFMLLIWFGLVIHFSLQHRLQTDVRFARRLQAPRKAKLGLTQAKVFLKQQNPQGFYDAIFKVLQDYFGNKFHIPAGNITADTIQTLTRAVCSDPKSEGILKDLKNIFNECELIRYASGGTDPLKMPDVLSQTENIIDFFERSVK